MRNVEVDMSSGLGLKLNKKQAALSSKKGDKASFQIANGGKKARFVLRTWREQIEPTPLAPEEQGMTAFAIQHAFTQFLNQLVQNTNVKHTTIFM